MPSNSSAGGALKNRPIFLQVRDALAARIANENWRAGQPLPSEADLAREFGVSAGTMRKALELLEKERVLTRRQGRGTYVNDQSAGELATRYFRICGEDDSLLFGDVRSAEISEGPANERERSLLGLGDGALVYRMKRLRVVDDDPVALEEASVPAALFPGLQDNPELAHHIVPLAQRYGLHLGKAEERIAIGTASAPVAKALKVRPGAAIAVLDRVVRTLEGHPAEWQRSWCDLKGKVYLARVG